MFRRETAIATKTHLCQLRGLRISSGDKIALTRRGWARADIAAINEVMEIASETSGLDGPPGMGGLSR